MECNRLAGLSALDCACRLPAAGGWAECPPEARRVIAGPKLMAKPPAVPLSGDSCPDCGNFGMVRSGTCMTCTVCGSTSGGCS